MFSRQELLELFPNVPLLGPSRGRIKGVSTDSRTIKAGELFIPLSGAKFDGRKFIPEVLRKKAWALDSEAGLILLQQLAAYHRRKFRIPIIGVTGSVGKTTTKEMIASILSRQFPILKNEENQNNEIGVPLTLLQLNKRHRAAVVEMAMQKLGEIDLLARLVKPTIAVVTNIGESHLAYLKTRQNIARAKAEIFNFLRQKDFAVINQDDEYFEHLRARVVHQCSQIVTFGLLEKAQVTPQALTGIKLPVLGEHHIYNALAAIAVAKILRIKQQAIKQGLEKFTPSSKRQEVINRPDGVKIINDTYNASPQSMAAALKVLAVLPGRKIAVLGDMLELGKRAPAAHRQVIKLADQLKIDKLYTHGACWPKNLATIKSKKTLIKTLKKFVRPHDIILIKGSRGMRMEEVVNALR